MSKIERITAGAFQLLNGSTLDNGPRLWPMQILLILDANSPPPSHTFSIPPVQHTDLEVCALEIARLQEALVKERARAQTLACDLQAKEISDQLDEALLKSEKKERASPPCRDELLDEFGGFFLSRTRALRLTNNELRPGDLDAADETPRTGGQEACSGGGPSWQEARNLERDNWDDEKAVLLLQVQHGCVALNGLLTTLQLTCLLNISVGCILMVKVSLILATRAELMAARRFARASLSVQARISCNPVLR